MSRFGNVVLGGSGGLRRPPPLFQLGSESVQITQHGGIRLAALEFREALFEVVEQARGIGAYGPLDLGCGRRSGGKPAPQEKRAARTQ